MTLNQAIDRYTNNAEYERIHGSLQGCLEFRQLAEWLKDYKRLLEQQPCEEENIEVLTSREMGEWLGRRENRLLDKIRAEIEAEITPNLSDEQSWAFVYVLQIIDKYR